MLNTDSNVLTLQGSRIVGISGRRIADCLEILRPNLVCHLPESSGSVLNFVNLDMLELQICPDMMQNEACFHRTLKSADPVVRMWVPMKALTRLLPFSLTVV